jgi:hypothetical protein
MCITAASSNALATATSSQRESSATWSIAFVDVIALLALAGQTALRMMFPAMPRWRPKEKPPL